MDKIPSLENDSLYNNDICYFCGNYFRIGLEPENAANLEALKTLCYISKINLK